MVFLRRSGTKGWINLPPSPNYAGVANLGHPLEFLVPFTKLYLGPSVRRYKH